MLARCLSYLHHLAGRCRDAVRTRLARWTQPAPASLAGGLAADLVRSKQELVLENALLRQQLIILNRSVKRPALTARDRGIVSCQEVEIGHRGYWSWLLSKRTRLPAVLASPAPTRRQLSSVDQIRSVDPSSSN